MARIRLQPSARGAGLLAEVLRLYGSIQAAARAAGLNEQTLRRLIYRERPLRAHVATVDGLARAGLRRDLLNLLPVDNNTCEPHAQAGGR